MANPKTLKFRGEKYILAFEEATEKALARHDRPSSSSRVQYPSSKEKSSGGRKKPEDLKVKNVFAANLPERITFRGATYVIAVEVDEIKVPEVLKKNKKPKPMPELQHVYDEAIGALSEGLTLANAGYFPPAGIRQFIDKVVKLDSWDSSVQQEAQEIKNNFNRKVAEALANAEMAVDYLNVVIDLAEKYGLVDTNTYEQYLSAGRANLKDFRKVFKDADDAAYYDGFRALFEN